MRQTKNDMNFDNMKWKMWWYEEDLECIMKLTEIQLIDDGYSCNDVMGYLVWSK